MSNFSRLFGENIILFLNIRCLMWYRHLEPEAELVFSFLVLAFMVRTVCAFTVGTRWSFLPRTGSGLYHMNA